MNTLNATKDKLQAQYEQFIAEVKEAQADARIASHAKYGEFQSAKNDFETTWNDFVNAAEEQGEDLQTKAESKYKEMKSKWDEIKADL